MRFGMVFALVLGLLACEEGNPAQRDDEGGGGQGGAAGEGGAGGDGGSGGAGGELEPDAGPDAGPYDDPRWGDDGLWHGWPEDPNDLDELVQCSHRCGGCKKIKLFRDGVEIDGTDGESPWRVPTTSNIQYEYALSIGRCAPSAVLPRVTLSPSNGTREQGPSIFYVDDHVVEVTPTDANGRGRFTIRAGETPRTFQIEFRWHLMMSGGMTSMTVQVGP